MTALVDGIVELTLPDPRGTLRSVALLHELRRPRRVEFAHEGRTWRLAFPQPEADRMEYLLELTYRNGRHEIVAMVARHRGLVGAWVLDRGR